VAPGKPSYVPLSVGELMAAFHNYVAGEWIAGASATPNRNPSNLADVIGEYAHKANLL